MKLLYLYSEVMGYTLAPMKILVELGYEIHVVYWDKKKLTPFKPEYMNGIYFYPRSDFNLERIYKLVDRISPKLIVVSGWMDKDYLKVIKKYRKNGGVVVSGIDNQVRNGLKQFLTRIFSKTGFFKKYFSHIWVPGVRQFEFAKAIGFSNEQIIFDLLTADTSYFNAAFKESISSKKNIYPKKMLFVGRFVEVKGILNLIEAWNNSNALVYGWELILVGNGPLKEKIIGNEGIRVFDFMTVNELADLSKNCGCFILPSINEPWGVVIHEFSAAGLPIICTKDVGASERFVIHHGNGVILETSSMEHIKSGINEIAMKSDKELIEMGILSNRLSKRITPETSALNLLSTTK